MRINNRLPHFTSQPDARKPFHQFKSNTAYSNLRRNLNYSKQRGCTLDVQRAQGTLLTGLLVPSGGTPRGPRQTQAVGSEAADGEITSWDHITWVSQILSCLCFFLFTWEKGTGSIEHFSISVPCNFTSDTQQAKERERGRAMKDWVSVFEQPSRNEGFGNNRKPASTYNTRYSAEENSSPHATSTSLQAPLSHTLLLQQNILQQAGNFQETWSELPPYQCSHCLSQYLSHITDSCYHFLRLHELSLLTIP